MLSSPVKNGFSPADRVTAANAAGAGQIGRQRAGAQLRPYRTRPQLRVREVEVIAPLGDVIRELVADREAQPHGPTVLVDDIESDDLGFLTRVECEIRVTQSGLRNPTTLRPLPL